MECGGKRSATPLWLAASTGADKPKRRRRCALPAHSIRKMRYFSRSKFFFRICQSLRPATLACASALIFASLAFFVGRLVFL